MSGKEGQSPAAAPGEKEMCSWEKEKENKFVIKSRRPLGIANQVHGNQDKRTAVANLNDEGAAACGARKKAKTVAGAYIQEQHSGDVVAKEDKGDKFRVATCVEDPGNRLQLLDGVSEGRTWINGEAGRDKRGDAAGPSSQQAETSQAAYCSDAQVVRVSSTSSQMAPSDPTANTEAPTRTTAATVPTSVLAAGLGGSGAAGVTPRTGLASRRQPDSVRGGDVDGSFPVSPTFGISEPVQRDTGSAKAAGSASFSRGMASPLACGLAAHRQGLMTVTAVLSRRITAMRIGQFSPPQRRRENSSSYPPPAAATVASTAGAVAPPGPGATSLGALPFELLQQICLRASLGRGGAGAAPCADREMFTAWKSQLHLPEALAPHLVSKYGEDLEAALTSPYSHPKLRSLLFGPEEEADADARAAKLLALAEQLVLLKASDPLPGAGAAAEWAIRTPSRGLAPPVAQGAAVIAAPVLAVGPVAAAPKVTAVAARLVVLVAASAAADDAGVVATVLQREPGCCSQAELNYLLRIVVNSDRSRVAEALLDGGADIGSLQRGPNRWDPEAAIRAGHLDTSELLLDRGALPGKEWNQQLLLNCACEAAAERVIRVILRRCVLGALGDLSRRLHLAAAATGMGSVAAFLEELPKRGVSKEALQSNLDEALSTALSRGPPRAVEALVLTGADGIVVLRQMGKDEHVGLLELLQRVGYDVVGSAHTRLVITKAAFRGQRVLLQALLDMPGMVERHAKVIELMSFLFERRPGMETAQTLAAAMSR